MADSWQTFAYACSLIGHNSCNLPKQLVIPYFYISLGQNVLQLELT